MRIVKNAKYALIGFLVLVCEMTFGKYIAIDGAVPMLSFSLCLAMACIEKDMQYVAAVSAVMGALLDFLSGHGFGTYTMIFLLAALGTYAVRDNLFSSKILLLICDVFVMTVVAEIIYYLFHINDIGSSFWTALFDVMMPTALYNIFATLVFYSIFKILFKRR